MKSYLLSLLSVFFLQNCTSVSTTVDKPLPWQLDGFIATKGQRFVDSKGRELILHGINVVNKDPKNSYLGHVEPEDFKKLKSWGFNVIRLGIIWDGLEPEPGVYNEAYLQGIDEMIGWARDNGLYVFLDMHQDLYSVEFSDGAPTWATLDNDLPHQPGEIWSDAYLLSPAVQTAFDNFWENAAVSDGMGVQDHYINLWKYLAARYADNTAIIGYDIMNEPFMGSEASQIMPLLLQAYGQILVEKFNQPPPSEEELLMMWSDPESRLKVLETLSDKEGYRSLIDAIYEVNSAFEKGPLYSLFQKARDAIREVDRNHIIFIEHSYFTNMGVTSGLQPLFDENGQQDPLVAYAGHGYDLVVDTDAIAAGSNDRVELIFERIAESGQRMNMPVLIGEWGALPNDDPKLTPVADFLMQQFNKHLFSDTYWTYGDHIIGAPYIAVLRKPYPVATSGELVGYSFDRESGLFTFEWEQDTTNDAPSVVYFPNLEKAKNARIKPSLPDLNFIWEPLAGTQAGYLIIPATKTDTLYHLIVPLNQ